ncbi:hypothetical protein BCV70DRAFT_149176, partial [Testicularia cyperi]
STRPSRGMPAPRGTASLRGGMPRPGAAPSNASMVPSRASYASPSPSPMPSGSNPTAARMARMQFRPVMPQRRKASESPAPSPAPESSSTGASPLAGPSTSTSAGSYARGGASRGRGRGGARPPRQPVQMTASGPFALGPSSRPTARAKVVPMGPGGANLASSSASSSTDPSSSSSALTKTDPDRSAYRNPDKLQDAEAYSDDEDGGVEIIDLDQVHALDELAPRALPRIAEKKSKKERQRAADQREKAIRSRIKAESETVDGVRVKSESEADQDILMGNGQDGDIHGTMQERGVTVSSGTATPQPEDESKVNTADALDLSESEGEEIMDDLVDDFVFNDLEDASPENRLYLFQFPQLFPRFKQSKSRSKKQDPDPVQPDVAEEGTAATNNTAAAAAKRRSVSFAEGTTGGAGSAGTAGGDDNVKGSAKDESDSESDSSDDQEDVKPTDKKLGSQSRSRPRPEGQIGKLDVYRDGRVFFRFGELVMEVTGGSQSTFLQQVMLLDAQNQTATTLGELHRKFVVTPELDCMLNDISLHEQEQREEQQRKLQREQEKQRADRAKYAAHQSGFTSVGGR